ncbi:MAG: hypothetical protein ACD_11C00055G0004 [uncultured bacterium]|nr:MAG: hypothetical protein ACD_11C00055G0004 [uncultured bacterium]
MAEATEYSATVSVTNLLPVIASRPVEGNSIGYTRIYFSAVTNFGTCRTTAADLQSTTANNHVLAILLTAFAQGKSVTVYVDSTLTNEDVCQVTVLTVPQ